MENDSAKRLHELIDADWEYEMEQFPTRASYHGDRRYNDRWTDMSFEAIEARHRRNVETLARLREIDRAGLSSEDRLNYDLFENDKQTDVEGYQYSWRLLPIEMRSGVQSMDNLANVLRFAVQKDYEDWIARLEGLGTVIEQTMELMKEGVRQGMMHPKVVLQRVPRQIEQQIVENPEDSGFYRPFRRVPDTIRDQVAAGLRDQAKRAIREVVVPAYKRLHTYFVNEYLPSCLDDVGIWQLPNGADAYPFFVRRYTTTDMTPDEVHEVGLVEVERIRGEMERVKKEAGFSGPLRELFEFMRTDEQFYYKTGDELLTAVRAMMKRIDPLLVRVFHTLPRTPYGVEPIPEAMAPDTTMAYYEPLAADGSRAGTYRINLYKPETRPKYELMALSMHEAVPGHHLQVSFATELPDVPNFRRHGSWTGYVEGWALYSESLGDELGLYDDPYSKIGQLTYEIWRAVRLVVDTGIHWKRWSRQQAIDYFLDNAPKTELDVVNEIDRYIVWPAQAVAYKIGELKMKELRRRAEQALGGSFDLKEFHHTVLKNGPLPLSVLDRIVDKWIVDTKSA